MSNCPAADVSSCVTSVSPGGDYRGLGDSAGGDYCRFSKANIGKKTVVSNSIKRLSKTVGGHVS